MGPLVGAVYGKGGSVLVDSRMDGNRYNGDGRWECLRDRNDRPCYSKNTLSSQRASALFRFKSALNSRWKWSFTLRYNSFPICWTKWVHQLDVTQVITNTRRQPSYFIT